MFNNFFRTIRDDIWQQSEIEGRKIPTFIVRAYKILVLTIKGFGLNNCYLKASALTFYTVLSIVPLAALAFAIAKGFGLEDKLRAEIMDKLHNHQDIMQQIISFSDNLLARTAGGLIAGIGAIFLLWTIIRLFTNIENAFNEIWGIKQGRIFLRKVTDYLSMCFICPLLLIISASFTAFIYAKAQNYSYLPPFIVVTIPKFFSYFAMWMLFTFFYRIMPNCKMRITSAIIPGIIVGSLFNIIQLSYLDLQILITTYNGIYGSFAALPLFLFWIQITWIIVIAGAQLSFYIENIEFHEFDYSLNKISFRQKKILCLMVMKEIVDNFIRTDKPVSAKELCAVLKLPSNLTQEILDSLVSSQLISLVYNKDKVFAGYHPSTCTNAISLGFVLNRLDNLNSKELNHINHNLFDTFKSKLMELESDLEKAEFNIMIKDI